MLRRIKTTAMVLSLALAFSGLCGCGGEPVSVNENVDMDDPNEGLGDLITDEEQFADEDNGSANEEDTEAPAKEIVEDTSGSEKNENEYEALYRDKMDELKSEGMADQFSFANIDEDDIPELIARDSEGSFDHDNAFIFTLINDEVVQLASVIAGVDGGNLDYSQGSNLIHVSGAAAGMRDMFYEIKDGKLEEVFRAEATSMDEDAEYSINGTGVKEEEYYEKINDFMGTYNPLIRIAYNGLYEINYTYEDGYGYFAQDE